ncbi:ArsR family transcriptional regulator [Streptomyces sp. 3MP-14]|uniref:ArsR family transcriptional regulator n=1 Tax=Streptomyces mimosae TaxID=2586635 RepID=A0A5N5ZV02_9ACTN|nr:MULTISPECIES: helix-turn-helix domain-containing protein [Streptomyces]KAB8158848.1 ArsR family transcriptional regulator [Streptomyces mimosae]KAB8172750.1 ArsR family transcriptional regulator [Streptomyces sp. 3MP-14]
MAPVLTVRLTAQDLTRVRLTYSPLFDAVISVRLVKEPAAHALYRPWREQVAPRLAAARAAWAPLAELVPTPVVVLPGFLSEPRPSPVPDLAVELAALRALAPELVRRGTAALPRPWPPGLLALREDPASGLARLADAIEAYWELAIAPYWPRVRALLDDDLRHRARALAEGGMERLFNGLDPAVRWADERLTVAHPRTAGTRRLGGRGLLLTPTAFGGDRVFSKVTPPWQPTLRYPARGVATLWERGRPRPPAPLAGVIGRSRALLLVELTTPASTGELAERTGLTAGGVSQHLTALRTAGLVTSHRVARRVLYARTVAGETLLRAPG